MVTSPAVSWLFFKARAKRPYLSHTGRASNAEKQPTGPGPEGCVENGPAAALLVGYVSIQICALLAPCRRPILNATTSPLFARRCTKWGDHTKRKQCQARFLSISKAKTRCISHRVMPVPLFRGGKKRSFGLQISSVPDGTLIIARREMFEQSIKEPEGLSDPPSKRARQSQE